MLAAVKGTVSRSCVTPLAGTITAGYDARDPLSLPRAKRLESNLGKMDLRGLRVAVAPNLGTPLSSETERIVSEAADALVEIAGCGA